MESLFLCSLKITYIKRDGKGETKQKNVLNISLIFYFLLPRKMEPRFFYFWILFGLFFFLCSALLSRTLPSPSTLMYSNLIHERWLNWNIRILFEQLYTKVWKKRRGEWLVGWPLNFWWYEIFSIQKNSNFRFKWCNKKKKGKKQRLVFNLSELI